MLTAIIVLAIINVAVFIHELAHYLNARSVGLPVRAFSIGMGPILWRRQWRGTEWRLSLLPLGGYVDLPGLAAETDEAGNLQAPTKGFALLNVWQKLWVLIGGVLANFILAILLIATVTVLEPAYRQLTAGIEVDTRGTIFAHVVEDSPAEEAGILAGDVVRELNGFVEPDVHEVRSALQQDGTIRLVLERNGELIEVEQLWAPEIAPDGSRPLFGVGLAPLEIDEVPRVSFPRAAVEATSFSVRILPEMVGAFVRAFASTFAGQRSEEVAGPVGIVRLVNQAAQMGLVPVLFLAGAINLSLALFNLLPIPGLDGGRILLAIAVAVRGRPFRPGQEEFIHFLGFAMLITFLVLITFREVSELFRQ